LLKAGTLARLSLFANGLAHAVEFSGHLLVRCNNIVERVSDLPFQANPRYRKANRKVAVPHGLQASQYKRQIVRLRG
jgi:hypothetical protein